MWIARLKDFEGELPQLQAVLSLQEAQRAAKFHFQHDQTSFILRHGILRILLGHYLSMSPREIAFSYGPFGKPEIEERVLHTEFQFNHSHSGDMALYAVSRACPIGLDVERVRPFPYFEEIASWFFMPSETQQLMALPNESRLEGFFSSWTRKEAILKATGEGISNGLSKVEVTVEPLEKPELVTIASEPKAETEWHLHSFSPAPGFLAAVATLPGCSVEMRLLKNHTLYT